MITTRDLNTIMVDPSYTMTYRDADADWITDRFTLWNVTALGGLKGGWPSGLATPSAHAVVTKGEVKPLGESNLNGAAIARIMETSPDANAPTVEWTSYATLVEADSATPRAARLGLYDGRPVLVNAAALGAFLTLASEQRWAVKVTAHHPHRALSVWRDTSKGTAYAPGVARHAPAWRRLGLIMAVRPGNAAELAKIATALDQKQVKASA